MTSMRSAITHPGLELAIVTITGCVKWIYDSHQWSWTSESRVVIMLQFVSGSELTCWIVSGRLTTAFHGPLQAQCVHAYSDHWRDDISHLSNLVKRSGGARWSYGMRQQLHSSGPALPNCEPKRKSSNWWIKAMTTHHRTYMDEASCDKDRHYGSRWHHGTRARYGKKVNQNLFHPTLPDPTKKNFLSTNHISKQSHVMFTFQLKTSTHQPYLPVFAPLCLDDLAPWLDAISIPIPVFLDTYMRRT